MIRVSVVDDVFWLGCERMWYCYAMMEAEWMLAEYQGVCVPAVRLKYQTYQKQNVRESMLRKNVKAFFWLIICFCERVLKTIKEYNAEDWKNKQADITGYPSAFMLFWSSFVDVVSIDPSMYV